MVSPVSLLTCAAVAFDLHQRLSIGAACGCRGTWLLVAGWVRLCCRPWICFSGLLFGPPLLPVVPSVLWLWPVSVELLTSRLACQFSPCTMTYKLPHQTCSPLLVFHGFFPQVLISQWLLCFSSFSLARFLHSLPLVPKKCLATLLWYAGLRALVQSRPLSYAIAIAITGCLQFTCQFRLVLVYISPMSRVWFYRGFELSVCIPGWQTWLTTLYFRSRYYSIDITCNLTINIQIYTNKTQWSPRI